MKILIKGAGDLATGIGFRLFRAGYVVWMTDLSMPTSVRRSVSFSSAIYEGQISIESMKAVFAPNFDEALSIQKRHHIPILADPTAAIRESYRPEIIVDAIMAKENTGTKKEDAGLVIGVGPGFYAGKDCHLVVETKRGHYLGRVIRDGSAIPNTGIPGDIGGYTIERLIKADRDGEFDPQVKIGDFVEQGQIVALIAGVPVKANMSGLVRGILHKGIRVFKGMKAGDIDARCKAEHCHTISDKARAVGGGVLEAVCAYEHRKQ